MLWGGIALAVLGGVLMFLATRARRKAAHMETMETSRVGDLQGLVDEIAADLPGESTGYSELVELKGQVACDAPLRGELSDTPAAIVETTVERRVETRREDRDSEGRVTTRWVASSEVVSRNRREAPFDLDDGTGRVRVLAKGARFDLVKAVDRFEPADAVEHLGGGALSLSLGGFSLALGGHHGGHDRRTIGYHFTERILPVGHALYGLGEISDTSDGLVLRKPAKSEQPFVLSLESEQELLQSAQSSARWLQIGGIALIIGGVVLAVIGLVR